MDWREERRGCGYSNYRKLSRVGHFRGLQRNRKATREVYMVHRGFDKTGGAAFLCAEWDEPVAGKKLKIKERGNS